jgi:hypothetical protein
MQVARGNAFALSAGVLLAVTLFATMAPYTMASGMQAHRPVVERHALEESRELWATVDVCNPANEPNTVGIRGSMPSDGHPKDKMYMRFRLQYLEAQSKSWVYLAHGADSGFIAVGQARTARQGGSSFQLVQSAGKPAYTLRGVVSFQWRRGETLVHELTRTTSAGHQSVAGADPAGYSAAECTIS